MAADLSAVGRRLVPALGAARVAARRLARERRSCAPAATAAGPRSRPTSPPHRRARSSSPGRCCPASSTRTATPSSAPSPAWPSGATRRATTSGRGATGCMRSRCASAPSSCARSRRSSTSSCCAAATRTSASSTTCAATATAATTPIRSRSSWALADAAADAGIGLTILPVLYERAGFAAPALRDDQRRFRSSAEETFDAARRIRAAARPLVDSGLAIHSLRGASAASIAALATLADGVDGPIHIHVAEQTGEVDECLRATGARPIEWLAREGLLDARWQLVHATHATAHEIAAVAASGAGIVVCPSTEANLGDGLCRPARLARGRRADHDRLRQPGDARLARGAAPARIRPAPARTQRNVAAAPELGFASTAERLFERVREGSARAIGQPRGAWSRRARRRARRRSRRRRAARHRADALARRARLQQPDARRGAT